MKTVVYADVYFILNFSIDLICLVICGAVSGKSRSKLRISGAAAIGGIYACAALFITYPYLSAFLTVLVCIFMYYIAYLPNSFGGIVYGGALLFCVNALFGGLYSAIVSLASGGGVATDRFRYYPLFLTIVAVLVFIRVINSRSVGCVSVKIKYLDKTAEFRSLVDSANSLKEPISGVGIAMIAGEAAKRLFSSEDVSLLKGEGELAKAYGRGFRYVMIGTAAGSRKCTCVKADSASVHIGKKKTEVSLYLTVSPELYIGDTECLLPNSLNFDL